MTKALLGRNLSLDISKLIQTRILIQADSGGGKSWALRKLLEETHGKVQQVVLDMEGDFATLREKYDFILAGKGGDIPAEPRSADLLARRILELGTSLIVDLYELKMPERKEFVRRFCDALVNAPKDLWHPVLIVLDEAHVFVPEKGSSVASEAVTDLATRGRKRGFCLALATQRIALLSKDAAAQCQNKLIGLSVLDIDRKRSAEELGGAVTDTLVLRKLEPGTFYGFGPAMGHDVALYKIGPVKTTHPNASERWGKKAARRKLPKPTGKITAMLKKLVDLPKEAEQESKSLAELQAQVRTLKSELRAGPKVVNQLVKPPKEEQIHARLKMVKRAFEQGRESLRQEIKASLEDLLRIRRGIRNSRMMFEEVDTKVLKVSDRFAKKSGSVQMPRECDLSLDSFNYPPEPARPTLPHDGQFGPTRVAAAAKKVREARVREATKPSLAGDEKPLGACSRAILKFLYMRQGHFFTRTQVGAMTHYTWDSGNFSNAVGALKRLGFISVEGNRLMILAEGINVAPEVLGAELAESNRESLEQWLSSLPIASKKVYEVLLKEPDTAFTKQALGEMTGYEWNSGNFSNAIGKLNTLGLISKVGANIQLNPELRNL